MTEVHRAGISASLDWRDPPSPRGAGKAAGVSTWTDAALAQNWRGERPRKLKRLSQTIDWSPSPFYPALSETDLFYPPSLPLDCSRRFRGDAHLHAPRSTRAIRALQH